MDTIFVGLRLHQRIVWGIHVRRAAPNAGEWCRISLFHCKYVPISHSGFVTPLHKESQIYYGPSAWVTRLMNQCAATDEFNRNVKMIQYPGKLDLWIDIPGGTP